MNHNAQDINIKQYVHFKKVPSGNRSDCKLIRGIVFSKNVAHKHMAKTLENPKILLLRCSIVYQRTEGKLMSLEPVLMQEQEYFRHVTARIVALQPDIVLVQRTVSRLAQDMLREQGLTLVYNVKEDVLERLARCTKAELVQSIDAHIGPKPSLGTCKTFTIQRYDLPNGKFFNTATIEVLFDNLKLIKMSQFLGGSKTLMFFEGLPMPHLGTTVLLRGGSKLELSKLKNVASLFLFACYNWRLEKSFLMDEFAQPPHSKDEFFDESKETSPVEPIINTKLKESKEIKEEYTDLVPDDLFKKNITQDEKYIKNKETDKKLITESIDDFTDPLQSDTKNVCYTPSETFTVSELPFSNHFRKALDDTILSISPYLVFSVPYLETDLGRKCKLRNFFPEEIYYSKQFTNVAKVSKDNDGNSVDKKIAQKAVRMLHYYF